MNMVTRTKGSELLVLKIGKVFEDNDNNSYDLRSTFSQLNIYSSINDIITTGDVTITESGNLISTMPIVGQEYIEVKFCSLDKEYEEYHRIFFVYAVDTIVESRDVRTYCIRFTDAIGLINNDTRIGIKYTNKFEDIVDKVAHVINNNADNIVYTNILNKYISQNAPFVFEKNNDVSVQTGYEMKFVVPLWKPLRLLSYLARRAVSKDSVNISNLRFCDCVFYQNRKGKFIFSNYKKMFLIQQKDKFGENIVLEKMIGNTVPDSSSITCQKYAVLNYSLPKIFNIQSQKISGMLGFTDNVTDFLNVLAEPMEIQKSSEDSEAVSIDNIIEKYDLKLDTEFIPYEAIYFSANSVYFYNECGINTSISDEEYKKFTLPYEKSIAVRQYIEYAKISLEITGSSDIDIGKFVKINLGVDNPKSLDKSVVYYINDMKWVVSSVTHSFSNTGEYKTYITCFAPYLSKPKKSNYTGIQG